MEHDFCGLKFLKRAEIVENFQTSQETTRTKYKANHEDDNHNKKAISTNLEA
jgi:hypothetical protein